MPSSSAAVWEDAPAKICLQRAAGIPLRLRHRQCRKDYVLRAMADASSLGQKDGGRLGRELSLSWRTIRRKTGMLCSTSSAATISNGSSRSARATTATCAANPSPPGRVKTAHGLADRNHQARPVSTMATEAGLTGKDPDNLDTYPLGHETWSLLRWVKRLTALRRKHVPCRRGGSSPCAARRRRLRILPRH